MNYLAWATMVVIYGVLSYFIWEGQQWAIIAFLWCLYIENRLQLAISNKHIILINAMSRMVSYHDDLAKRVQQDVTRFDHELESIKSVQDS